MREALGAFEKGEGQPVSAARLPSRKRVLLAHFMTKQGASAVSPKLCRAYNATVGPGDRYRGREGWRNAARDFREETRPKPTRPSKKPTKKSARARRRR
jgi:hypothetical protein